MTTVAMVISLFVSIALIFSGAQVYRVHSASAEIQEVADVAALASQNEVAEFKTVAAVCDAILLSMGLTSAALSGLGIVAACVPPAAALSEKLIDMGLKTAQARDRFYDQATAGLDRLQRLLPFLCTVNAIGVAKANDQGALSANYFALAQLLPPEGEPLVTTHDDLTDIAAKVTDRAPSLREDAAKAEGAAAHAQEAKLDAFRADCGDYPDGCMRERAESLSSIAEGDNPHYASVDAWSFSVALKRIQAYYQARLSDWTLAGSTVEEKANAVIRKRFYEYADEKLRDAFIVDTEDAFSYQMPHLFRNTDELRATELFKESAYPVTLSGEKSMMHAWTGCPRAAGFSYLGSLEELDRTPDGFETCPLCEFTVASVGNVAAASTAIANGFEHHYERFRQALAAYAEARAASDPLSKAVKEQATPLLEELKSVLSDIVARRIEVAPPGNLGSICLVVNMERNQADTGFESLFVQGDTTLGVRAAVSASTDVPDEGDSIGSLITGLVNMIMPSGGVLNAGAGFVVGLWETVLTAYEKGHDALISGVSHALGGFSQNTASGLGDWASKALSDLIKDVGFEPADTRARKPIILNSAHPAQHDDSSFAVSFMSVKRNAVSLSSPSTGFMGTIASKITGAFDDALDTDTITIAHVELPFMQEEGTIEIPLPDAVREHAGLLSSALNSLLSAISPLEEGKVWQ